MEVNNPCTLEHAAVVAALLPGLARHLFVFEDDVVANLPISQLRMCAVLYEGQRPMSEVSRELGVSLSATTQMADRLERAGLVRRVAAADDRRVKRLRLTERGRKLMHSRETARVEKVAAVLDRLPSGQQAAVRTAFETLLRACEELRDDRPQVAGGEDRLPASLEIPSRTSQ